MRGVNEEEERGVTEGARSGARRRAKKACMHVFSKKKEKIFYTCTIKWNKQNEIQSLLLAKQLKETRNKSTDIATRRELFLLSLRTQRYYNERERKNGRKDSSNAQGRRNR